MQGTLLPWPSQYFETNLCLQVGQECQGTLVKVLDGMTGLFRRTTLFLWITHPQTIGVYVCG